MDVFIANNPAALRGLDPHGTVEAEFGDVVVEGSMVTLAHHGARSGNPAPCVADVGALPEGCVVGISHMDLDTLGGLLALMGQKPEAESFWQLAAFVDVNGPHKMEESGASLRDFDRLRAYWAWADSNKVNAPKDGSVLNVTEETVAAGLAVRRILNGYSDMIDAGIEWAKAKEAENADSFVDVLDGVILRQSTSFVNHLYVAPGATVESVAVVSHNPTWGSVTLSFRDDSTGLNACEIVQELWGSEAGGHKGIAGSPRDVPLTLDDARACAVRVRELVS